MFAFPIIAYFKCHTYRFFSAVIDKIRESVAHCTCAPFSDIADEDTLIINTPWDEERRTLGIEHAACGVSTQTKYTDEDVRPLAAGYGDDGSLFLLWERKANYTDSGAAPHVEDICGCTYVKMSTLEKVSVISLGRAGEDDKTFRL
eukprot:TRINITY_DN20602_c0_g1_i1.p2 TRINITY_DN20602_c0_g1~~TRINITY_DN20602_c0_g1_i1.p2  ORF type:complete len:146 (-),score=17.87 TRINITY_DN20602_c0_g1_i1:41-478(-)